MGGGLAFLSKKRFNPSNISNQRAVWEARQRSERESERAKERADQLKRERDDEELARARGGTGGGDRAALRFLYDPPPGLPGDTKRSERGDDGSEDGEERGRDAAVSSSADGGGDLTRRQPGDDAAAAAFRAMLAASSSGTAAATNHEGFQAVSSNTAPGGGAVTAEGSTYDPSADVGPDSKPQGGASSDSRTFLEKAVGRKDGYNRPLTLDEQVQRFPQLKNAPVAAGLRSGDATGVSFKPMGVQIRNVRCLKCGIWGHSKGDRECKLSGWNPFSSKSTTVVGTTPPILALDGANDHGDTGNASAAATAPAVEGISDKRGNDEKGLPTEMNKDDLSEDSSEEDKGRRKRKHHRHERRHRSSSKKHKKRRRDDDHGRISHRSYKKYHHSDESSLERESYRRRRERRREKAERSRERSPSSSSTSERSALSSERGKRGREKICRKRSPRRSSYDSPVYYLSRSRSKSPQHRGEHLSSTYRRSNRW